MEPIPPKDLLSEIRDTLESSNTEVMPSTRRNRAMVQQARKSIEQVQSDTLPAHARRPAQLPGIAFRTSRAWMATLALK
eukprot:4396271-Pleurochrysis_carterae.AAC.1